MGLHFYRNPDKVDIEDTAAKLDRAAAQTRSTIRRDSTIRPGRDQSSSSGLTNIIRTRHELRQAQMRAQRDTAEADAQIEILELELERLRRRHRNDASRSRAEVARERREHQLQIAEARYEARERALHHSPTRRDRSTPNDVYLTQNENELAPLDQSSAQQVLLPRPARESNLRFETTAPSSMMPASPQRTTSYMPSPPHSLSDSNRNRPVDGPLDDLSIPPLTQGFAPALAAHVTLEQSQSPTDATTEVMRITNSDRHGLETPPPETWEHSYPPLRRVPHMSPRPLLRATVDGLGDRRRSPSPISETQEEETWNNLLATMDSSNPGASTTTSFSSMTDVLDTSQSNTQNTSTSFGEIGNAAEDLCDLPPGITEDDARRIRERHRRTAGRVNAPRRWIPEVAENDYGTPAVPITPPVGSTSDEHRRRGERVLRDGTTHGRELSDSSRRREDMAMLQAIMQRQQGQPIPEEWWALVGLPPGLARAQNES